MIATCSSPLSRNNHVGRELAKGKSLAEIHSSMKQVAEGIDTTSAAVALAEELDVEMPIARATYDVLFNRMPIRQAISNLLERDPAPEWAGSES